MGGCNLNKHILIIGCDGQDGRILTDIEYNNGSKVYGINNTTTTNNQKIQYLNIDISDYDQIYQLLCDLYFDKIYYLAAYHVSSDAKQVASYNHFLTKTISVNVIGVVNFLEAIEATKQKSSLFYASSALIFNDTNNIRIDENTRYSPLEPYAMSKVMSMGALKDFSKKIDNKLICGIYFNHESAYRTENFLTAKLVNKAIDASYNLNTTKISVGNLDFDIEMGHAKKFMQATFDCMNIGETGNYIISTGRPINLRKLTEEIFIQFSLNYKDFILEGHASLARKAIRRVTDNSKISRVTREDLFDDEADLASKLVREWKRVRFGSKVH